jgi:probable HAF family extracellular repeat protein
MKPWRFEIRDLSPFGEWRSWVYALNGLGRAVGEVEIPPSRAEVYHAYLWWPGGQTTDLQTLGGPSSSANDINSLGHSVGWADNRAHQQRAVLWRERAICEIGAPPGYPQSTAYAINDEGDVAGYAYSRFASDGRAFLWRHGKFIDLGTLGGVLSWAHGLNNHGCVVGWVQASDGKSVAVSWSDGRMEALGTLGGAEARAYSINDQGEIVGWSDLADGRRHACLWRGGSVLDLTPVGTNGLAKAINGRGEGVGTLDDHACVFREGLVLDLNQCLVQKDDWVLREATSINDAGQIVGLGRRRNETHGFRLDPVGR